jgi:phosphosulfolactate phosphohydrolase-like enzyme
LAPRRKKGKQKKKEMPRVKTTQRVRCPSQVKEVDDDINDVAGSSRKASHTEEKIELLTTREAMIQNIATKCQQAAFSALSDRSHVLHLDFEEDLVQAIEKDVERAIAKVLHAQLHNIIF